MIKNCILAFALAVFIGGLTYGLNVYFKSEKGDFFILEKGKPVPDFAFETFDGASHSFADYKNQDVLIHFWASWCAPCVVEFPDLVELAQSRPDISVLAISSDRTEGAIQRFLDKHAPDLPENFHIVYDRNGHLTRDKFSVFALPETFYVRKGGIFDSHIIGAYADWERFSFE
tara:strand:+ start:1031 stop:1549 length:519 start_codon:yes stop_codon:yes gene_type:complete